MLNKLFRRRPLIEELEPRILYSADLAPFALDSLSPAPEQRVIQSDGEFSSVAATTRNELVIVDAGVEDYETLLADILNQAGSDRHFSVVMLGANRDGIEQISDVLKQYGNLDAVHLISHGGSGVLQLGNSQLDASSLESRAAEIAAWGTAFNTDADLLLYGCDVAAGTDGESFVQRLAALTRADVTASDDPTGNVVLGGDWVLEYSAGQIESNIVFSAATRVQWQGLLETLANTTLAPTQTNAAVAANPLTGDFVVTWTSDDADHTGIFARVYDTSGTPLSVEIAVNTTAPNDQMKPAVAMATDGSFVVVWQSDKQDGDNYGIYARRFDAAGTPLSIEIAVNDYFIKNQTDASIAMAPDGSFVVAWKDDRNGGDVYVRHFSTTGAALSNEILVNTNTANGQILPAVAMDSAGNYVVAWQSDSGGSGKAIFAQRFDLNDIKLGSEFRVNTYDSNDQTEPAIAMAPDGRFVITWTSNNQDGGGKGVYAQRYAADGTPAGGEFRVNTVTNHDQETPTVAMDASGNFVIAWQSDNQDGDKLGIYAQRYFANGTTNGGEFLVNSTTPNDQKLPSAAMSGAGDLFIAWEGNGAGDNKGIFWQNYVAANNPPVANADTANTDEDTPISSAAPGVLGNDTDPDAGAVLSVTAILAGTSGTSTTVTAGGVSIAGTYGSLLFRQDGSYVYTPNASTAQALAQGQVVTDVFTYTIKDEKNANASSTLTVTINGLNDAPVATADSYAVAKNDTLNVVAGGVLNNDTDVDANPVADTLSVTQVNGLGGNVGTPVAGTYGTLTLNADGSLSYVSGSVGGVVDSFTYQVSDGKGGTSTATLNITVSDTNTAPVANNDPYTTDEDTPLIIPANGVISNDTDIDGNVLSATLVSGVSNGVLIFSNNGAFTYTPNANYSGSDSFTYQVSDGSLTSGIATVTLTVNALNDDPVAFDDTNAVNQDATLTVSAATGVLANDTDVDVGDTHEVILIEAGSSSAAVTSGVPGVLTSPYGTLTLHTDGSYTYIADGVASKALGAGETSDDTFSYTMQDAAGVASSATLTITITGSNDAPTLATPTAAAYTDTAATDSFSNDTGTLSGSDVDSGATLTYGIAGGTVAAGVSTLAGSYGTLSVNTSTGAYTYTPNAAAINALSANTTESFTVNVGDGAASATATYTVSLTGANDDPVPASGSPYSVEEEKSANVVVSATDAESNTLSFSITGGADAALFTIDASSGLLSLSFVPNYETPLDANGDNTYEVIVTISDGNGGLSALAVQLVVTDKTEAVAVPPSPPAPISTEAIPDKEAEVEAAKPILAPIVRETDSAKATTSPEASDAAITVVYQNATSATPAQMVFSDAQPNRNNAPSSPTLITLITLNQMLGGLSSDSRALQMLQNSLNNGNFLQQLDQLQDTIRQQLNLDKNVVASTLAVSTGLSVGYVIWLVRGGVLLSSLLTSLPAWRLIDPLPILGHLGTRKADDDEDESLEGMLKKSNEKIEPVLNDSNEVAP